MKRLRKGFLLTLLALCVALGAMIVGCKEKKNTITISFETNGAQETYEPIQVAEGEEFILQVPTKQGFEFVGWYDNAGFNGTPIMGGSAKAPKTDTTYFAKWAELKKVSLSSGDGVFSDGTNSKEVYVASGKLLLEALAEYTPTFGNLSFGAWFIGGNTQVDEKFQMPSRDIICIAKYSVGYSVEIYTQKSSTEGYDHDTARDFTDMGFYGDNFSVPAPEVEGFEFFRNHPNGVTTLVLSEDASKNVFKLYYNKQAYTIIYNVNTPASVSFSGFMADQKVLHGETGYAMECGYTIRAYRFAGWSRNASGEVEYRPGDELPEGSYTLYAIWDAGYSDIFGGSDFIFFPHEGKDGSAILQRGNAEIIGRTNNRAEDGTYTESNDGMFVKFSENLIAKLVDSNPKVFSFLDENLKGEYSYYSPYFKADDAEETPEGKLTLDGFDGATLTSGDRTQTYSFGYDVETGYYTLTANGATSFVILGKQGEDRVFTYVGAEKGEFQQYVRVSAMNYSQGSYMLKLDGLGNASWGMATLSASSIKGKYEAIKSVNNFEFVTVHLDDGTTQEFVFLGFENVTAVSIKDEYVGEYKWSGEGNNGTLVLDGFDGYAGGAKLGNDTINYMVETNILGTVVNILDNNRVVERFRLDAEKKEYSKLDEDYSIYRLLYALETSVSMGPQYLIIYNEKDGDSQKAEIRYQEGAEPSQKLYDGTVTPDKENYPLSYFKASTDEKNDKFPYTEFSFSVSDMFTVGPLFYVYLYDDPNTEAFENNYMYIDEVDASGNTTGRQLLLYYGLFTNAGPGIQGIGSFIIEANGDYIEGNIDMVIQMQSAVEDGKTYFGIDDFYSLTYLSASNVMLNKYFAVYMHGDDMATATYTVEEVPDRPLALAEVYAEMPERTNTPFANELSFYTNGKGEARILANTNSGPQYVKATYMSMGDVNGREGYRVTYTDEAFPEILGQEVELVLSDLNANFYHVHNKIMEGMNTIENGGYVELDGWGTHAKYVDNYGHEYEGYYTFFFGQEAMVIYTDMNTGISQVYIVDGKFVNTPPETKGQWRLVDQNFEEYYKENAVAIFDGNGGVTVEDIYSYMNWQLNGGDGNQYGYERKIYGRGFYTAVTETEYDLEVGFYNDNGDLDETIKWRAKLQDGCCIRIGDGDVGSYIQDSDKAVLYLDGYGSGFYIDGRGNREDGNYLFVDENIGMFINDVVSYMVRFSNSNGNRSFTILNNPDTFKTFYADDLSSIEFGDTLRINGQEVGLWYIDENDNFIFYELTDMGFKQTKTYSYPTGDTYTIKVNDKDKTYTLYKEAKKLELTGSIIFRKMEEKNEEHSKITDAKLVFTPDGSTELNASASLTFTDFRDGSEAKTYNDLYTVKMIGKETILGQNVLNTYHLFLCYGDMELALRVNTKDNTFELYANISAAGVGTDLGVYMGQLRLSTAEIVLGMGYTLGVANWALTDFDPELNDVLVGGYMKACDNNGDLIFFEVLYNEFVTNQDNVVGYQTEEAVGGDIPIYEIFSKTLAGDGYVGILLEMFVSGEASIYFSSYATVNFVETTTKIATDNKGGSKDTSDFKVYKGLVIATGKSFGENDIAYLHVFKKLETNEQKPENDLPIAPEGFKSISTGYAMYLKSGDMFLVQTKTLKPGSEVLVVVPKFVKKNEWNYDELTLWFGVNQYIPASSTEKSDDPNFDGVAFEVVLLSGEYRAVNDDDKTEDTRTVLDGWLIYYYIANENDEDIPYNFLQGYGEDGVTRISRLTCKDEKTMYDLSFSGKMNDVKVDFKPYTPPKEDDEDEEQEQGE